MSVLCYSQYSFPPCVSLQGGGVCAFLLFQYRNKLRFHCNQVQKKENGGL